MSSLAWDFSLPKEKGKSQEDSGRQYREAVPWRRRELGREVAGERLWRGTEVSCRVGQAAATLLRCFREEEKGRRVKKKKRRGSDMLGQENGPHWAGRSRKNMPWILKRRKLTAWERKIIGRSSIFFLSAFYYLAKLLKRK
jgi:hypothetical protein